MVYEPVIRLLRQVEIFNDVPDDLLETFAASLKPVLYPAGSEIIRKGENGDSMFVISDGKVKIHDGEHVVATLETGNFFGEFSLLDAAPRSMSVSALEKTTALVISRALFFDLIQKQPEIAKRIVSALTRRLRRQNESIISQLKNREAELTRLVEERTRELKQKNEEITTKNKEITDNVNYARRIQLAILPEYDKVEKSFPDSFILYMPKDIVSGDFYALFDTAGKTIILAADCTGHGVTGAFLSVVGNALLTQIINEKNITDPGKILDSLSEEVVNTLNQRNGDSTDGMDIAICSIDHTLNVLQYAGANRPLWLIRDNELLVYSPDKFPVGGTQIKHEKDYLSHEIQLRHGDAIYLFTDGYADQFGGPDGKKLMTKKFKELLLSCQQASMQEQKNILQKHYDIWKGNHDQVDDVLVIGIKIK